MAVHKPELKIREVNDVEAWFSHRRSSRRFTDIQCLKRPHRHVDGQRRLAPTWYVRQNTEVFSQTKICPLSGFWRQLGVIAPKLKKFLHLSTRFKILGKPFFLFLNFWLERPRVFTAASAKSLAYTISNCQITVSPINSRQSNCFFCQIAADYLYSSRFPNFNFLKNLTCSNLTKKTGHTYFSLR